MFHPGLLVSIGIGVLLATFAFAMWKGEVAERIGGSLNLAAGVFAIAAVHLLGKDEQTIAQLVVDAVLAMGFLFLAIRFASMWLGMAMLLQAVQFSLHAYYLVSESAYDLTYARINNIDTTGINICIILGTVMTIRRRMRLRREAAARAEAQDVVTADAT
jgi:hypothetical protein